MTSKIAVPFSTYMYNLRSIGGEQSSAKFYCLLFLRGVVSFCFLAAGRKRGGSRLFERSLLGGDFGSICGGGSAALSLRRCHDDVRLVGGWRRHERAKGTAAALSTCGEMRAKEAMFRKSPMLTQRIIDDSTYFAGKQQLTTAREPKSTSCINRCGCRRSHALRTRQSFKSCR